MTPSPLRFAPEAIAQVEEANLWWRENRQDSPDLFLVEFEDALSRIQTMPGVGSPYVNDALPGARRIAMSRTRLHVYFVVRDQTVVVAAVWSAFRAHGPPLGE